MIEPICQYERLQYTAYVVVATQFEENYALRNKTSKCVKFRTSQLKKKNKRVLNSGPAKAYWAHISFEKNIIFRVIARNLA